MGRTILLLPACPAALFCVCLWLWSSLRIRRIPLALSRAAHISQVYELIRQRILVGDPAEGTREVHPAAIANAIAALLLHPPLNLAGVSIGMVSVCQQFKECRIW